MISHMTSARQRIGTRDVVIAGVMSALGLLLMYANVFAEDADRIGKDPEMSSWVHIGNLLPREAAFVLFLLVTVPLLWRRVAPLAAVEASLAGLLLNFLLVGSEFIRCGVVLPVSFLFAFTTGSQLDGREARLGLALSLALPVIDLGLTFGPATMAVLSSVTAVTWAIGRVVRSRTRMAGELEARTRELRDARDERARLEVATDRARLSGELDDLLQQRLGDLARLADRDGRPEDPATAAATLVEIERESRRTLDEMRTLVGVLRAADDEAPTAPQPALTHLDALLVRARGEHAHLAVEGSPRALPASVELSAYRIVEHLLDALDQTTDVDVAVRFGDDVLQLRVAGHARRGARPAIERARSRAAAQHGAVEATTRGGRAEALVSLPIFARG